MGGSSINGGLLGKKEVCGNLKYEKFTNCFTELVSMEGKYAVKLSITDLIKIMK